MAFDRGASLGLKVPFEIFFKALIFDVTERGRRDSALPRPVMEA